ncbi:hypothetical protein SASPL_133490 [Salvia splendens]|uniref:Uncharacterized protein n=1 Tax=Salvia splendens TaxID=180675 RepID=A0A8X8ZID8_SALSN|nr:hypothetical protein SASPL_133490 [Salvia splendens]
MNLAHLDNFSLARDLFYSNSPTILHRFSIVSLSDVVVVQRGIGEEAVPEGGEVEVGVGEEEEGDFRAAEGGGEVRFGGGGNWWSPLRLACGGRGATLILLFANTSFADPYKSMEAENASEFDLAWLDSIQTFLLKDFDSGLDSSPANSLMNATIPIKDESESSSQLLSDESDSADVAAAAEWKRYRGS